MEEEIKRKSKMNVKIFKILLLLACITLGILVFLLLFSTTKIAIETGLAMLSLIALIIGIMYVLPVLGVLFVILGIMYLIRALQYKGKKSGKILTVTLIFIFLVISIFLAYYTFIQNGLTDTYEIKVNSKISEVGDSTVKSNLMSRLGNEDIYVKKIILKAYLLSFDEDIYYEENGIGKVDYGNATDIEYGYLKEKGTDISELTRIPYKLFGTAAIVLIVLLCINSIKQYKLFSSNELNKKDTIKIISVIGICILGIIIIIFAAKDYKKHKVYEEYIEEKEENTEIPENTVESDIPKTSDTKDYFISENIGFRVELDNLWRDRYTVEIYTTSDNGQNWEKVDSNLDEVYIGSEFMFLTKDIGFVHDPYGGVDSYDTVKITTDGGQTWNDLNIDKPEEITANNIFFRDLPTMEDEKLKIIAYTVQSAADGVYEYYEFESEDLGESWDFVREVTYSEILKMDREKENQ